MFLSGNLIYLRKREGITQEELADQLGVSRQSVSKWETGESYPETDKLLLLCDIFQVSLDALMRSELDTKENVKDIKNSRIVRQWNHRFSIGISLGVFFILFGIACCVALSGYAETLEAKRSEFVYVFCGVFVVTFVAIAVFLFMFFGISYDRFCKENPKTKGVYTEEQLKKFNKCFIIGMPCLVSGILIDVVILIILTSLIDFDILLMQNKDSGYCFITSIFLLVLAFLVGGLVYFGIQHKNHLDSNSEENNSLETSSSHKKIKDALCGVVMMLATAFFLLCGIVWNCWHPAWVVFPIGGILCGIISIIFEARDPRIKKE